jgi:broad specificity phosphatase PhoE
MCRMSFNYSKLLLARHAQTEWNLAGRVQGSLDSPLTAKGVRQAHALAEAWGAAGITRIVASPAGRALRTATIVAGHLGCPLVTDARLVEQHFGRFEGALHSEVRAHDADAEALLSGLHAGMVAPGGESMRQAGQRVHTVLADVPLAPGTTTAFVTHGHSLQGLLWMMHGEAGDSRAFKHANTAYTEIHADAAGMRVARYAVATHAMHLD